MKHIRKFENLDNSYDYEKEEYEKEKSINKIRKNSNKKQEKYLKKDDFFYTIKEGEFLICDIDTCSKSERTFDINFFDLVKNRNLQKILFGLYQKNNLDFADFLSHYDDKKREKLLNNPKLRILVQDPDLFLDVLGIFNPGDIRVDVRKYNL